ncbi:MAG: pyruvate kinase [Eubacteriales bacterium]
MRKTKIICTIGPASQQEDKLREVIQAGMNVARFNFSHGDHEEQTGKFANVLKISGELGIPVATLLDTKGPEVRIVDFKNKKEELVKGQKFTLTTEDIMGTNERVSISYKNLIKDIKVGTHILIDDGLINLVVDEVTDIDIICTVTNSGAVSDRKGINVPGVSLSMPFISEKDRADIVLGAKLGFDFIAASFARTKSDILEVRAILDEYNSKAKIIAKIENMQGVDNIDEIIEVSDGIMVARGDMGVEIPMEDVPVFQKKIIKKTVAAGKQVITATQMLDSMMKNPRPTRAETTDVANAIYDGTTAIMLSGETANGMYPVEAVKTMAKIAKRAEADIDYAGRLKRTSWDDDIDTTTAISHATCTVANNINAAAIISVTMSGFTANMISRYKPECPVIGCSVNLRVCRQINLTWGVTPVFMEKKETEDELFAEAIQCAINTGIVKKGDQVVLTAGVPLSVTGRTNMIRVVEV